jgi:hypothetical protein
VWHKNAPSRLQNDNVDIYQPPRPWLTVHTFARPGLGTQHGTSEINFLQRIPLGSGSLELHQSSAEGRQLIDQFACA